MESYIKMTHTSIMEAFEKARDHHRVCIEEINVRQVEYLEELGL